MTTRKLSTFRLDGQLFGVAVEDVQEVTRTQAITPVPLAPPGISGLMNLRGQVVTVIDLRHRLGYAPRPAADAAVNVVIRSQGGAASLLVDSVEGFHDVTDDQFAERPEGVRSTAADIVLGAYKLEDELLLALDARRAIDTGSG